MSSLARFEQLACSTMNPSDLKSRLFQLEEVLLRHLPRSVHMLTICKLALQQRFPKQAKYEFHRYVEGEDNWPNGYEMPLIVCIQRPNLHTQKGVVIMSPLNVTAEMLSAFDTFIGWDTPQLFHSVPEPFWPVIRTLSKQHNNLSPRGSEGIVCKFYAMLDIENAKKLEIPEQWLSENKLRVRPLEDGDAHEVISNWHFGGEHSEEEIKKQTKLLPSCGLVTEEGELASSVLQTTIGLFNVLYTPDKFRRRGFGHIVMAYVSREAAQQLGTNPLGEAEPWNVASCKLMEKLGYEYIYNTAWFYYDPSLPAATA